MNLAELRSAVPSGESARAAAIYQHDVSTAVTARRYATHLGADLVTAPGAVVAPLTSPEEVQALLAIASTPQLIRAQVPVGEDAVTGDAVLLARLGLPPGSPMPSYFTYQVVRGDTVTIWPAAMGCSRVDPVQQLGNHRSGPLGSGSTLSVPTRDGVVYTVLLGDTFDEIVANYAADGDATLAFAGNNLPSAAQLVEGETILLVNGSASVLPTFGSTGSVFGIPIFRWPMGGVLSDFFGAPRGNRYGYHTGIDLSAPPAPLSAPPPPGW